LHWRRIRLFTLGIVKIYEQITHGICCKRDKDLEGTRRRIQGLDKLEHQNSNASQAVNQCGEGVYVSLHLSFRGNGKAV